MALILPVQSAGLGDLLDGIDRLILSGGRDSAPEAMASCPTRGQQPNAARDEFELALVQLARDASMPLNAICRGIQVLNVACGGTLHQHLPDVVGQENHPRRPAGYTWHSFEIRPQSHLARNLATPINTASHHLQAIARVRSGLEVAALAGDGTIEAVEDPTRADLIGVQWHPEVGDDDTPSVSRVEAARARGRARSWPPPRDRAADWRGGTTDGSLAVVRDETASRLLDAYEAELRLAVPRRLTPGVVYEWDGPVLRASGERRGFVVSRDLSDTAGTDLDALIARQREYYSARGESFEWKTWSHIGPADLGEHLVRAGLRPGAAETVLIAETAAIAQFPVLPGGVSLRVASTVDLPAIAEFNATVWREEPTGFVDYFGRRLLADPGCLDLVVAEHDGRIVSAGRVEYELNSSFASLWGGSTLAEWRRRGIYRATVAYRAQLALEHGKHLLQVDASQDSRPILERLGFTAVASTTPYVWHPRDSPGRPRRSPHP